jgi:hypothetical protein
MAAIVYNFISFLRALQIFLIVSDLVRHVFENSKLYYLDIRYKRLGTADVRGVIIGHTSWWWGWMDDRRSSWKQTNKTRQNKNGNELGWIYWGS